MSVSDADEVVLDIFVELENTRDAAFNGHLPTFGPNTSRASV